MSEPVTKQRASIDFDEFERALRDGSVSPRPQLRGQEDDPLAELARLVATQHDPYGDVFAQDATGRHPAPPQGGAPYGQQAPYQNGQQRLAVDFAAIEAGLRGSVPVHQDGLAAQDAYDREAYDREAAAYYAQHDAAQQLGHADWQGQLPPVGQPVAAATRSRRPVFAMAAVIAAGVVGIGVAFAYKGSNSGPREIAMIKAAPGPTKIQPPADEAAQAAQDAAVLANGKQPTKLVSREEQPVDLAQAVQNAPREVGPGITPLYNFGSGGSNAASVPVPAPPGLAPRGASVAGDIEPIRVKTRSYRPDGTPIPNDQPPSAAAAAPPVPKVDKGTIAKASTPKVAAPKSTTRVAATPKPIVTADRGEDAPSDINAAAEAAPRKPAKPATARPVQTAKVDSADETASTPAGGGFAVQVAAPGSEAEAKQTSTRLTQKFADALNGRRLSFRKAESNGKSVYRVRVSSLSREEATELCDKLKSSGGTCFVAKN